MHRCLFVYMTSLDLLMAYISMYVYYFQNQNQTELECYITVRFDIKDL